MLMMDEKAAKGLAQLRSELAWLRENHPELTAVIGCAEQLLATVRAAGSCESFTVNSDAFAKLQQVH